MNTKNGRNRKSMSIKKRNYRRRKIKLHLKRAVFVLAFLTVLSGVLFACELGLSRFFHVEQIQISGNTMYDEEEIINKSSVKIGDSLIFTNVKKAEKIIFENFAYVDEVKIKKQFPNKLIVNVKTAEPYYAIIKDEKYYIISKNDKLLQESIEQPEEVLSIIGLDFAINNFQAKYKNSDMYDVCRKIIDGFAEKNLNSISFIDVSNDEDITVVYDNRVRVMFGDFEDFEYKLVTAKEILSTKIGPSEKGSLDLRTLTQENKSYFTSEH